MGRALDWLLGRSHQPKGVQTVQVVQVNAAPEPDSRLRRVCKWCKRSRPLLEVGLSGLCQDCQRISDRREASLARMKGRT